MEEFWASVSTFSHLSKQFTVHGSFTYQPAFLNQTQTVTLIEGDGIGPEISSAVRDIFTGAKVHYYPTTITILSG